MKQLQMKEALIISYSTESDTGKVSIKLDEPNFETIKNSTLIQLFFQSNR